MVVYRIKKIDIVFFLYIYYKPLTQAILYYKDEILYEIILQYVYRPFEKNYHHIF